MFERFTDSARHIVVAAQEEARHLNHRSIGTEHLTLGLLRVEGGTGARVLSDLGVDHDAIRTAIVAMVPPGSRPPGGHVPFTPRAKMVFELSLRESLRLGHDYIGTTHILIALLREADGAGAQAMVASGADLAAVEMRFAAVSIEGDPEPAIGRDVSTNRPTLSNLDPTSGPYFSKGSGPMRAWPRSPIVGASGLSVVFVLVALLAAIVDRPLSGWASGAFGLLIAGVAGGIGLVFTFAGGPGAWHPQARATRIGVSITVALFGVGAMLMLIDALTA